MIDWHHPLLGRGRARAHRSNTCKRRHDASVFHYRCMDVDYQKKQDLQVELSAPRPPPSVSRERSQWSASRAVDRSVIDYNLEIRHKKWGGGDGVEEVNHLNAYKTSDMNIWWHTHFPVFISLIRSNTTITKSFTPHAGISMERAPKIHNFNTGNTGVVRLLNACLHVKYAWTCLPCVPIGFWAALRSSHLCLSLRGCPLRSSFWSLQSFLFFVSILTCQQQPRPLPHR